MDESKVPESCAHGTEIGKPCGFCAKRGIYFKEDASAYEAIYKKTGNISFELAFEIAKRVERWEEAGKDGSLESYFKQIESIMKSGWGRNSLKKAYYVARDFPDLVDPNKVKLSFSNYKEIVTARLSDINKLKIRQAAEEKGLNSKKIRMLIKEYQEKVVVNKVENKKETITFHTKEDFLKEVDNFLQRNNELEAGTRIILEIKKSGGENGQAK